MGRDFYKAIITDWASKQKKLFAQHTIDNIFTFLEKDSAILEIGPGIGHFADEFNARNFSYTAVEPSMYHAKFLRDRGYRVIEQITPPIPFEDNSLDFILANHVLEHLPTHVDAVNFLLEIKRTLKVHRYCCISFPNWIKTKNIFFEIDYSHNFITTKLRVSQMLNNVGLNIKSIYYTNGQIKLRKSFYGWILRCPAIIMQLLVNRNLISVFMQNPICEDLLCKIRKTVHESIYMIIYNET
jgi:SAM-dependent methyltransferase